MYFVNTERASELRLETPRTSPEGTRACACTRLCPPVCPRAVRPVRSQPHLQTRRGPAGPGCLFQVCVTALILWGPSRPAAQDPPFLFCRLRRLVWIMALNLKSLSMESESPPRYPWSHRGGGGSGRLTPFSRASLSVCFRRTFFVVSFEERIYGKKRKKTSVASAMLEHTSTRNCGSWTPLSGVPPRCPLGGGHSTQDRRPPPSPGLWWAESPGWSLQESIALSVQPGGRPPWSGARCPTSLGGGISQHSKPV